MLPQEPEHHMSRTDKTQPFRVRLWDGTLRRVAVHDHRDGVCNLPADEAADLEQFARHGGRIPAYACHWEFTWTGVAPCCCSLCHDPSGLRAERRANRHDIRRALGALLKEASYDWRDLD